MTILSIDSSKRRRARHRVCAAVAGGLLILSGCEDPGTKVRSTLVKHWPKKYEPGQEASLEQPAFTDRDASRPRVAITLKEVASGFKSPTDIQFVPGHPELMVVAEKEGDLKWFRMTDKSSGTLAHFNVLTASEEGLLGVAFHPRFPENGQVFVNYVASESGKDVSRIARLRAPTDKPLETATLSGEEVLLRVPQPYPNHNAGQIAFGPDGYLYVGWGDGGWADDPHRAGQNPGVLLGKMLRIDVNRPAGAQLYSVPEDNPFVGRAGTLPEIWAIGLRNPWRFSFDPEGRLIVGDVGQNQFEEVSEVTRGGNLGWSTREAAHCFRGEGCSMEGLTDPLYEYGREDGASITGGYVVTSARVPALQGRYVFGDFVSGRMWALKLPAALPPGKSGPATQEVTALGRFPILLSTFGRDAAGDVYAADFGSGKIFRLEAPAQPPGK